MRASEEEEVLRRCDTPGILADWYDDHAMTEMGTAWRWMWASGKRPKDGRLAGPFRFYWGYEGTDYNKRAPFSPETCLLPWPLFDGVHGLSNSPRYAISHGSDIYLMWAFFSAAREAEWALGRALLDG